MKKSGFIAAILLPVCLIFVSCDNQDDNNDHNITTPGATVENAFSQKFPGATGTKWEQQGNYFNAEFLFESHATEAWFNSNGLLLQTETKMPYSNLPEAVREGFSGSFYGQWVPDNTITVTERPDSPTLYFIDAELNDSEIILVLNQQGQIVKEANDEYDAEDTPSQIAVFISKNYSGAATLETLHLTNGTFNTGILYESRYWNTIFTRNQQWEYSSAIIPLSQVPQVVQDVFSSESLSGFSVVQSEYRLYPSGSLYRFRLRKAGSVDISVNISPSGQLIPN